MLDKRVRKSLSENYESAFGNFDLYIVFIERGLDWLKQNGKFGYIISNQFTNRGYGEKLRKFILKNSEIISIIDFARTKVFKDVTNYPAIMICKRTQPSKNIFKFISVKDEKPDLIKDVFFHFKDKEYSDRFLDIFEVDQSTLSDKPWQFSLKKESKVLEKIDLTKTKLIDVSKVLLGIQTGKDSLLIGTINKKNNILVEFESKIDKGSIETDLIKPLLRGRDVRKWLTTFPNLYVLCPHDKTDFEPLSENVLRERYSGTFQFIKSNEKAIRERKWYGKTAQQLHGVWYALMYYEQAKFFSQPKILTPALTNKNNFTIDNNGNFFVLGTAGVYGIVPKSGINIKYLLGILNSSVSEYYLKKICPIKQGGYFQYSTNFLKCLPIKLPETAEEKKISDQIIKKADEILELHKSGIVDIDAVLEGQETDKLHQLPKVSFNLSDNAKFEKIKSDGNKIFINSQDFIEIKDRNIRDFAEVYLNSNSEKLAKAKDVKNMILNISVPKSDEVLKEIVKKGGADQSQIKEKIKKLEDEINELVYQLYGITKEERKIIEGSL